jgi:moderate conductance mechanosensitive channel
MQELITQFGWKAARIAGLALSAILISWVLRRAIKQMQVGMARFMNRNSTSAAQEIEKRSATIAGIVSKTGVVGLWCLIVVWMLEELGLDIAPLLAGAGVAGLAVGFGAQNLVRDVISGLFILLENQLRLRDIAVINGTAGMVEEINLRTLVLRSADGAVHVFPNGAITTLTNLTFEYSFYVLETGIAYKEDTDRVVALLRDVAEGLRKDQTFGPDILEPLEVLGVDRFAESSVVIRSRLKTQPGRQWVTGRELNRRVKQRFDAEGIEIPFPHQSVYFGEASRPIRIEIDLSNREQWRDLLQEALAPRPAAAKSEAPIASP